MYIQNNKIDNIAYKSRFSFRKQKVFNPHEISRIAQLLNIEYNDVYKHTNKMSVKQLYLLKTMAKKYNSMYYYAQQKENPENLFCIIDAIPAPKKIHHDILNNITTPFENILSVLKNATGKKDIKFIKNFESNIYKNAEFSQDILKDILTSPNKEEFITNIAKYKSYLRLNRENPNAIKELEKMIANKTYKQSEYDKAYNLDKLQRTTFVKSVISDENLDKYYSESSIGLIKLLCNSKCVTSNYTQKDGMNILKMYQTCTPKNIETRKYLIDKFSYSIQELNNLGEEIEAMNSIFEKVDKNKYTQKFINKYLKDVNNIKSLNELNSILENVVPEKGYIFHKNLVRILNITKPGEERARALKEELENLSYETDISRMQKRLKKDAIKYGFVQPESKWSKFCTGLENKINKIRYSYMSKNNESPEVVQKIVPQVNSEEMAKQAPEIVKSTEGTLHTEMTESVLSNFAEVSKLEHELVKKSEEASGIMLVNTIMSKAQQKKIKVQNSVKEYIHKTLHPNIVSEQEKIYTNKATKMRFNMLPEILSSIKETRAKDKAAGIKRSRISNRDAVDLYTRINGQNRKLVNYMLKKRNVDGTRIFSVNDIMDILTKANRKVILEKMKRSESKAYYESLYKATLEQHGKLKTPKNNSSKRIN